MKFEKIHNKGQAQLFRNNYMEMLTKTHPLVIWGMYLPVISLFYISESFSAGIQLLEYFFHVCWQAVFSGPSLNI